MTLWSAMPGSSRSTAARCARPVTTAIRSSPESGASRSQVSRRRVCPEPGQVVQELGRVGSGERPQPAADAAGGDDGVEAGNRFSHAHRVAAGMFPARDAMGRNHLDVETVRRRLPRPPARGRIGWMQAPARGAGQRRPRRDEAGRTSSVCRNTRDTVHIGDHVEGSPGDPVPRPRRHVVVGAAPHHGRRDLLLPPRARARHRAHPGLARGVRRRARHLQEPDHGHRRGRARRGHRVPRLQRAAHHRRRLLVEGRPLPPSAVLGRPGPLGRHDGRLRPADT